MNQVSFNFSSESLFLPNLNILKIIRLAYDLIQFDGLHFRIFE